MKIKFSKTLAWVLIVYFSIGFIFAGTYLYDEFNTFECYQADGTIMTGTGMVVFSGNENIQQSLADCHRRLTYSAKTFASTGGIILLWLPFVSLKIIGHF
ncbi:MAG: hypothetical protein NTV62_01830 [Candidatus Gribaldobacteria bacterium]|nr:hypothetical protein [Candidatus Gribaldobacteria bacterium]